MLSIKKSWLCENCNVSGLGKTTAKVHVRTQKHKVTYIEVYEDVVSSRRKAII